MQSESSTNSEPNSMILTKLKKNIKIEKLTARIYITCSFLTRDQKIGSEDPIAILKGPTSIHLLSQVEIIVSEYIISVS